MYDELLLSVIIVVAVCNNGLGHLEESINQWKSNTKNIENKMQIIRKDEKIKKWTRR